MDTPVVCGAPPAGTYPSDCLLWFYRGHKPDVPFGSPDVHGRYLDCRMEFLRIQPDGQVYIKIWQPSDHPDEGVSDYEGKVLWGFEPMDLMGGLVQCRRQGGVIELLVEHCGKFYMRADAAPCGGGGEGGHTPPWHFERFDVE